MEYIVLKQAHIGLAIVSISGFILRWWFRMNGTRRARRNIGANARPAASAADSARRTARSAAKQRIAGHGAPHLALRILTWLMMLDVLLLGRVRSGPYFALFVKSGADTPERTTRSI